MNHIDRAKTLIEAFCIESSEYVALRDSEAFRVSGTGCANSIYVKSQASKARFVINFNEANNCRVFIDADVRGRISIAFREDNSTVYIGRHCLLQELVIKSMQENDLIAVGSYVTTAGKNTWISGNGAGNATPAIIIGDDCMFSHDVVIRNSDAHPVFARATDRQINEPAASVCLEPHVWIGEQVSILKSVTIGAGSIVALGSVVTKDVPRFSVAKGVPAVNFPNEDNYWSRSNSQPAKERAKYYLDKYRTAMTASL